jgi:hypothetical protein
VNDWIPAPSSPSHEMALRSASGDVRLRYEDVLQSGHLALAAMPFATGDVLWRRLLEPHPLARAVREHGVIPILSRMVLVVGDGPIAFEARVRARASFELARSERVGGEVEKLFLNAWGDLDAPLGRTNFPPPADAGRVVRAGRVFLEHTFTRLFAAPGERRVTQLPRVEPAEGASTIPEVPDALYEPRPFEELLSVPDGFSALGEVEPDPVALAFGLDHTDSNQHVNSLVHPRAFVEASLRRLAPHARSARAPLRAAALEIAYRKPFFAGEVGQVELVASAAPDASGWLTAGVVRGVSDEGAIERPRCALRAWFVAA